MKINHPAISNYAGFVSALHAKNGPRLVADWVAHLPNADPRALVADLVLPTLLLAGKRLPAIERLAFLEGLVAPLPLVGDYLSRETQSGNGSLADPEFAALACGLDVLLAGLIANYQRALDEGPGAGTISRWLYRKTWAAAAYRLNSLLSLQAQARLVWTQIYKSGRPPLSALSIAPQRESATHHSKDEVLITFPPTDRNPRHTAWNNRLSALAH